LSPWWRRRQVPPKRRFLQEPHGVTTQKTPFFSVCNYQLVCRHLPLLLKLEEGGVYLSAEMPFLTAMAVPRYSSHVESDFIKVATVVTEPIMRCQMCLKETHSKCKSCRCYLCSYHKCALACDYMTLHDDLKVPFIRDVIQEKSINHHNKLGNHSNTILQPLQEQQQRRRLKKLASWPNWWLKRIHSLEGTSSRYSKRRRTVSNPAQTIVIPYCSPYWNSNKEEG
jgi:hypothetical protein